MSESIEPHLKSDAEHMHELKNGSMESFAFLYERYSKRVYRQIYYMVGDRAVAQDLTQEVFLRLCRKAGLYKNTGQFSSWLYRMTRNVTLGHLSSSHVRRMSVSLDERLESESGTKSLGDRLRDESRNQVGSIISQEDRKHLRNAFKHLSDQDREIILHCDINELPHEEVAKLLGCPYNSVRVKLHRARMRLGKILGIENEIQ